MAYAVGYDLTPAARAYAHRTPLEAQELVGAVREPPLPLGLG